MLKESPCLLALAPLPRVRARHHTGWWNIYRFWDTYGYLGYLNRLISQLAYWEGGQLKSSYIVETSWGRKTNAAESWSRRTFLLDLLNQTTIILEVFMEMLENMFNFLGYVFFGLLGGGWSNLILEAFKRWHSEIHPVIEIPIIKTELLQVLLTYFVALRLLGGTCIVSLREGAWESALENACIPPEPENTPLGKGETSTNHQFVGFMLVFGSVKSVFNR